jgi:hypothetical protein
MTKWPLAVMIGAASFGGAVAVATSGGGLTERPLRAAESFGDSPRFTTAVSAVGHTHEPAGASEITDNDMSVIPGNGWTQFGISSNRHPNGAEMTTEEDPTAPFSPDGVLSRNYPPGYPGGGDDARIGIEFTAVDTFYVHMWVKLSSDFDGHSTGINKLAFLGTQASNAAEIYINADCSGSGTCRLELIKQNPAPSPTHTFRWNDRDNDTSPTPSSSDAVIARGEWTQLEFLFFSPTSSRGEVHAWVDGTEVLQFDNYQLLSSDWSELKIYPIWGGNGDSVGTDMEISYDHVYLSGM